MSSDETARPKARGDRIKLPIPFEEAVGDLLKVKPSPKKKKRRGKRRKEERDK